MMSENNQTDTHQQNLLQTIQLIIVRGIGIARWELKYTKPWLRWVIVDQELTETSEGQSLKEVE